MTYVRDGSEYTVTEGISLLTPEFSSRGGSAIEEVESVRKYAPKIYSTQNRAVTADDYETLIPAKIYPRYRVYFCLWWRRVNSSTVWKGLY